jgi:hypothetical protein
MKKLHLILGIACLSLISCEVTDLNTDPNNPSEALVPVVNMYPSVTTQSHRNIVALNSRIAGIVSQHYFGIDAQQIAYSQYNITESDADDFWDGAFYGGGAMTDCNIIIKNNTGEVSALAKLYMAANLGSATSMWGDIPYTNAFQGLSGNFNPTYDSQEAIYNTVQTLLTESINEGVSAGFGAFLGTNGTAGVDWEKTANALKARYYLHLTKIDPTAAASALAAANLALTSNAQQADFIWSLPAQNSNPLFLFSNDRPGTISVHPSFTALITGDPRFNLYTNASGNFVGPALFWGRPDSPTPLISNWELQFIKAEALVRTSGSDATALAALRGAVQANMEYVGVSAAQINAYTAALTLSGSMNDKVRTIVTEKYKSLFGNAPLEAWSDFRRTGFPALVPDVDAVPSVNPSRIVPRRFLYPISERLTNNANYSAAISAQGGHLLDNDIWAFPR